MSLHALAEFQRTAVAALTEAVIDVAAAQARQPNQRRLVALRRGAMLLEAPTGSGKTLMLGRTLEGVLNVLPQPIVWFWFAPYSGLVAQTRAALADQSPALRLRDMRRDREAATARNGDVFVETWQTVATNFAGARRVRQADDTIMSLDAMLDALRADGFLIGTVIDEAHISFGGGAKAAADFYLKILQPDVTLLATATPNDEKLQAFEAAAGVTVPTRVVIARADVVAEGLNKAGLTLGLLRFKPEDVGLIDPEMATLQAGWRRHLAIKARLAELGIVLTPLMLVQVENDGDGDPVSRVRDAMVAAGVPAGAIRTHTTGDPDPEFHTLAYDPDVEVLIFKVAAATGFDAPRAWTLVSVRPAIGVDFGLQVVGRIMRVHPLVRARALDDALLSRGYVFLKDASEQAGLEAAADRMLAVRSSIASVTERLDIEELGTATATGEDRPPYRPPPAPPMSDEERQGQLEALVAGGFVQRAVVSLPPEEQVRAIALGTAARNGALFEGLPDQRQPARAKAYGQYPLQRKLGLPTALVQEWPPLVQELNSETFLGDIARRFCDSDAILSRLTQRQRQAELSLKDLFLLEVGRENVSVRLSDSRVAEQAQTAFEFNDSIDPRLLKRALVVELRRRAEAEGHEADENDFRRAIDLGVMVDPGRLKTAVKEAQAVRVRLREDEPLPLSLDDESERPPARLAAYGIMPSGLNLPETAVAEALDADTSGNVLWWLRNPHNVTWATRILLPNGKFFFPDFAVGIRGRRTRDQIVLIEVKDDGVDGRLRSDLNRLKIATRHAEYGLARFATTDAEGPLLLRFNENLGQIQADRRFAVEELSS